MVRAESELVKILLHVLGRDVNVGALHRLLEQPPEAFDVVDVMHNVQFFVVAGILFLAVVNGPVNEAVFL